MNTFDKNEKWQFLDFNYNDAVTQQINMCTQQMLICRYNHVCLHGIFAYEYINVMTFKYIFGHYANKRFVERIPQFHAKYRYAQYKINIIIITTQGRHIGHGAIQNKHHYYNHSG